MTRGQYVIKENVLVADRTWKLTLAGDTSALRRGGQFVNIAIDGFFLRRPLAATMWDGEGFCVFYKTVGKGTQVLSTKQPGEILDALVGLGNGYDASACRESALVVCGSLGASPTFTLVRDLVASGKKVEVILGFTGAADVILEKEYEALGAKVTVMTEDGSRGRKGLVTDAMPEGGYDFFYTCGPLPMMKAVCQKAICDGEASLEERMGCGCGICYGCTCHTNKGPRRVCADGPVFKKEDIVW
ncbi:MAG: dihydroorotate dehydrogenase electron transfer subunit [Bacteroidales bacterium]|nr:dihydroorotate dehydrogenase electron transfer subunit [Bacteroidales bacterium]